MNELLRYDNGWGIPCQGGSSKKSVENELSENSMENGAISSGHLPGHSCRNHKTNHATSIIIKELWYSISSVKPTVCY